MDKNSKFCRLCLYKEQDISDNPLTDYSEEYIQKKLLTIGVNVSSNCNIPWVVCKHCLTFIDKIEAFVETINTSQKVLFELFNTTSSSTAINEQIHEEQNQLGVVKHPNIFKNSHYSSIDIIVSQENVEVSPDIKLPLENLDEDCHSVASTVTVACEKTERIHFSNVEFRNGLYPCDICSQNFDNFFDYQDHQEFHNGESVFFCSKCDEVFSCRKDIVEHENKHKISCLICQLEVLPKSLEAHMKKHTDKFKCNRCGSRHSSRAAMEKHVKARHVGVKGYVCHICGKQNSCQASMNRHLSTHLQIRPFKCKICNFETKSKHVLKVHTFRKHLNQASECEICNKSFKSRLSLKQHTKRIHEPKKYICKTCGKYFSEKFSLNQHLKKHTYKRVYECKMCHQEFFTTDNLRHHMHSHRTDCVNCSKCGKVFAYKKYLEKHYLKCKKNEDAKNVNDDDKICILSDKIINN